MGDSKVPYTDYDADQIVVLYDSNDFATTVTVECDECDGEGSHEVQEVSQSHEEEPRYRTETCDSCDGKGEREVLMDADEYHDHLDADGWFVYDGELYIFSEWVTPDIEAHLDEEA